MTVFRYDVYSMVLMAAFISLLGFILENLWLAVRKGYIDNRNMSLPFLLGYGVLVSGIYYTIGTPEDMRITLPANVSLTARYILYFLSAAVVVSIGEIALGTAVEHIFGFEYWNYESLPMHITKYTSVPTSMGFSIVITFFMGKCFEPIMTVIASFDPHDVRGTAAVLSIALTVDFFGSFIKMYRTRSLNEKWRIDVPKVYAAAQRLKYKYK